MENSHAAVSTKKGFNYGVWLGLVWFGLVCCQWKQGKQELLHPFRIITNIADQNALQEQPHNTYKVGFLEKQCNSVMKNYSAMWNVDYGQPKQNSCHLTHICCLLAFTDETCGESLWQELNWGQWKSDSPCLMQRVWVQEWKQSQSNMNSWWQ